jgi:DNA-binding transcriptional LysR family regulator
VDHIDSMRVFVTTLDQGSLVNAGRKLGRSPAAVSRAIASLEARVGTQLLHRTTRSIKMSEVGERYAVVCRRVLIELEEADMIAGGEQAAPRGTLSLTAPVDSGELVLRPILDAFLDTYHAVSARLHLLDRQVNLVNEGMDIALRMANLTDSSLVAIRVGEVRRVIVASPRYLAQHPRIEQPSDLAKHQIIAFTQFGHDSWSFPPLPGSSVPRTVQFKPRLVIDSTRGAAATAVDGRGITRAYSYQIADHVRKGELEVVLADHEYPPVPVHVITPPGRLAMPKVRAFVDFAVPRLRNQFARLAGAAGNCAPAAAPGTPRPPAR